MLFQRLIMVADDRGKRYLSLTGRSEHQKHRFFHPEYPAPEEGSVWEAAKQEHSPIYNNIISNSKEEAKAKAKAEAKAKEEAKEEKDLSLSQSLYSLPSLSPSGEEAATTSGNALGRESIEKRERGKARCFALEKRPDTEKNGIGS